MKLGLTILCLALIPLGCGGGDSAATSTEAAKDLAEQDKRHGLGRFPGHPNAPVPKKLSIENIEVGSGPVAERGDQIEVRYLGIDYRTGRVFIRRWGSEEPLDMRLGFADIDPSWEKGIEGMRVGGRRKLVIPRAPALHASPMEYLVDLVAVR